VPFARFAVIRIRGALLDELRGMDWAARSYGAARQSASGAFRPGIYASPVISRESLDRAGLQAAIRPPWTDLRIIEATESTNADLLGSAATTPAGTVLVAEYQSAGRGRLERTWTSPPRTGLTFSVLLRPESPIATWSWLPLLAGVAVRQAVVDVTGVDAVLKWPNDVLAGAQRRKAAGILAQLTGDAAVVGIGLNVTTTADELPVDTATSLALEGASWPDRGALLGAILSGLGRRYAQWQGARGDAGSSGLAAEYREHCATIGTEVTVSGTDGASVQATATGIDGDGRLVVVSGGHRRVIAAGDVRHLRPAP
jgi:BirA family biotin operon repressor/biotin-[acetyl-CoA-carboxylase] ligase